MRIAQVCPMWESVPPKAYGGIELVVSLLTEELVRRGHEVTLFASGDSITSAKLESVLPESLSLDSAVKKYNFYEMLQLSRAYEQADKFDVIHSHMAPAAVSYANLVKTPTVHTLHGIFDKDNEELFFHGRRQRYVSISDAQREPRLGLNYVATIYNGIDTSAFKFYPKPEDPPYLAFLGRLYPDKGAHLAIEIAKRTGLKLKMAGKITEAEIDYYNREIKPHIDGKQIEYVGEANHAQKNDLMGNAVATLFPIQWREPFGLVMIESMISGTPVIAMEMGSTPEVIVPGKTGFLCKDVEECIASIEPAAQLSRFYCREYVENNFSAKRMTDGYEALYQEILAERFAQNGHLKSKQAIAV